jgi:oxygen-independent coproporphyrinogen-3 oxidase
MRSHIRDAQARGERYLTFEVLDQPQLQRSREGLDPAKRDGQPGRSTGNPLEETCTPSCLGGGGPWGLVGPGPVACAFRCASSGRVEVAECARDGTPRSRASRARPSEPVIGDSFQRIRCAARPGCYSRRRKVVSLLPFRHLYVHIPFCRHKCGYCDFNAYAGMDRVMPAYVDALVAELELTEREFEFGPLGTVYFGGGTPSLLPANLFGQLHGDLSRLFQIERDAEVTLEANPASTDPERLLTWRRGGVNRLSLGVQGFDQRSLAVLERKTDGAQATRALRQAREAGFTNISVDLIYAIPFQTLAVWRETVQRAIELEPEHLSCYCLSFEEGTLLSRRRDRGLLPDVDADAQWEFLDAACSVLASAGYERYEVSSWARPGYRSEHNRAYWECRPVYGAGAGAHSYSTDGERAWRWWNVARPREYMAAVGAGSARADVEELEPRRAAAERLMMGLRTVGGLVPPTGFEGELAGLERAGLLERTAGGRLAPTRRGLDLNNQIALAVL